MKKDNSNKLILWFFLIILLAFELYSISIQNSYQWDGLFLIGFLFFVYYIKDRLNLHPFHFFLLGIFLVLHNLGVFGFYFNHYYGIEFDTYVHFYFGVVSTLILFRAYDSLVPTKDNRIKYSALLVIILGMSAFHELLEYAGGVILGEGWGFLQAGAGDIETWDTQTDMRNNVVGGLLAIGLYHIKAKFKKPKRRNKK
tara:strand:+ start:158 stop:751 length:594 start_codon:yes stop_codon:yes gene_type:complete